MISAQIKRGNIFLIDNLEDTLLQVIDTNDKKTHKPIKYTFYQFICLLAELCTEFVRFSGTEITFNMFLIDYYMNKYSKDSEVYRHFIGLTQSWKRYLDVHEDAKLFLFLLADTRNSKTGVKQFLKIRKNILKSMNQKILSQISVTHSDALTICHILFEGNERTRIIKRINQLFISLKRKLINTAKINGAIACEFFMNVTEELTLSHIPLKEIKMNKMNKMKKVEIFESQNPYNVSFSEEFASCYRKEEDEEPQVGNMGNFDIEGLNQEWKEEQSQNNEVKFGFQQARMSLKKLFEKDQDMDTQLRNSGIIKSKQYPEGWQKFLQTNRMMKEKLLNNSNNSHNSKPHYF